MFNEKIQHARFDLPQPPKETTPAGHPFKNDKMHARLLEYLQSRLESDKQNRDSRIGRYAQIDRDVAGWVKLSAEDRKRRQKHEEDGSPQATQISLPLAFIHLDDMMTYYAQTFAPNRGMFYQSAKPEDTQDATDIVTLMNQHAIHCGFYRQLLLTIFATLKYNLGGMTASWITEYGPKLEQNEDGTIGVSEQPVFRGNKTRALDMYNLFKDPSVNASLLHKDGEWFAEARMVSHYWLKSRCLQGTYFNTGDLLDEDGPELTNAVWYKSPPAESRMASDESSGGPTNWFSLLSGSSGYATRGAFELVEIYIRINPNDFGLIGGTREQRASRNRYEIWRFTILNNERIIAADFMNNIHGYLPAFFGVAHDDNMDEATKSPAEIINPLQQFSSFLLNAHVLANRKNIFGTTFYDPSRIDYGKIPEGEVAARVPIKPEAFGSDIRTMVYHDNNTLDTQQTLKDLEGMIGIVNQFFPTQSLPSQIAGIDRAVDSQVAAVQQGANRRQHKGARLLDDTLMRPLRFTMYYNIVQYQEDQVEIVDYFGNTTTLNLAKLRETNLAYVIGQGLKAIDRQAVAAQVQSIIFALIQAPQAAQGIDLIKMLDFWTSMMDIDATMEDFRLPPPPAQGAPGGTPEGAAPAAGGNPINPATNPANVTAPIYG